MPLTSLDQSAPISTTGTCPDGLTRAVRAEVRRCLGPQQTAERVAGALCATLPDPAAILPEPLRRGDPAGYQTHLLHAEPDGSFSIAAMVWLPGQQTPIHDHVAWCVAAVLQGSEHEEIFAPPASATAAKLVGPPGPEDAVALAAGGALRIVARNVNPPGSVSCFAPPGDIHRVRNTGDGVAISMHVYGADISRLGSSIRREY
jgi:3-mercaptopropionate dioxygenase